jgi:hypothetical protein
MVRMSWAPLLGLLLAFPALAVDNPAPAGNWKVILLDQNKLAWLATFEVKDKKWTGKINETAEDVPEVAIEAVAVDGDRLTFNLTTGRDVFKFVGKLPKGSTKQIYGTIFPEGRLSKALLAVLEPTAVTSMKEMSKELVANAQPGDAKVFDLVLGLLADATAKKAKPEEVRGWAEKAFKCAEPFGPHWQREVAVRTAETLIPQKGFEAAALECARRAGRLTDDKDELPLQLRVQQTILLALKAAGKDDEAKDLEVKVNKLEDQAEIEYSKKMIDFTPDPFKGRKEKSDRAVLVELFTGSECPPCVGADLGFEVLGKTFKTSEVILLQYHEHIPRPDPLANPITATRLGFYEVQGTPTILFNGKEAELDGGSKKDAKKKYEEYRAIIEPLLEKPAQAKLTLKATVKDGKISITAEASDLDKTGDEIRLRLVLVEEKIRFNGGNGVLLHHHVVRDMPGGADGLALKEKTGKQTATVDLADLRKETNKYLDAQGVKGMNFPIRPLDFKKLAVVAFVQNDKTKEVLQAVQVEVVEEK